MLHKLARLAIYTRVWKILVARAEEKYRTRLKKLSKRPVAIFCFSKACLHEPARARTEGAGQQAQREP